MLQFKYGFMLLTRNTRTQQPLAHTFHVSLENSIKIDNFSKLSKR